MAVSRRTALTIINNDDLIYTHAGPDDNGKYAGWITMPGGRPVLNTTHIFDTAELAKKGMTDLRNELIEQFG
jgi:hypothetical protein